MKGFLPAVTAVAATIPVTIAAGGPWFAPAALMLVLWAWRLWQAGDVRVGRSWLPLAALNWAFFYLAYLGTSRVLGKDLAPTSAALTLAGIPIALGVSLLAYRVHRALERRRAERAPRCGSTPGPP